MLGRRAAGSVRRRPEGNRAIGAGRLDPDPRLPLRNARGRSAPRPPARPFRRPPGHPTRRRARADAGPGHLRADHQGRVRRHGPDPLPGWPGAVQGGCCGDRVPGPLGPARFAIHRQRHGRAAAGGVRAGLFRHRRGRPRRHTRLAAARRDSLGTERRTSYAAGRAAFAQPHLAPRPAPLASRLRHRRQRRSARRHHAVCS